MNTLPHSSTKMSVKKPSPPMVAYYFYIAGVLVAMMAATVLVAAEAQTQDAQATDAPANIRYSASDAVRAFGLIDTNLDGKMSREEASGFRNIAKHFDAADSNRDGNLSIEEFAKAQNRP